MKFTPPQVSIDLEVLAGASDVTAGPADVADWIDQAVDALPKLASMLQMAGPFAMFLPQPFKSLIGDPKLNAVLAFLPQFAPYIKNITTELRKLG